MVEKKIYLDACCLNRPFDDQLLRNAKKYSKKIQIEIDNPINWIQNLI